MKETPLVKVLAELTPIQREATEWRNGAMLVLAGPGSGKTRVLTSRIASILEETSERSFRVLALTFTNKAADEMAERVAAIAPGRESRSYIGTFHSFCMSMLQQHGTHLGVKSNFTIYSQDEDRKTLLIDELRRLGNSDEELVRYLPNIDKLKSRLIGPEGCAKQWRDAAEGQQAEYVYSVYEAALTRLNALDFNSLVAKAYELVTQFQGVAMSYRKAYPYWMIDEFQDTTHAQYRFIKSLAGDTFKNVFVVADDDQIIYQWNGASFQQIQRFRADFAAQTIQLPTNYRCPPAIVNAANRLVGHNTDRTIDKLPLEAGKDNTKYPVADHISMHTFESDTEEAEGIAKLISELPGERKEIVVLARNRFLLDAVQKSLNQVGVASSIAQRRDNFLSPHFQWLFALLRQCSRPMDRRNFEILCATSNKMFEDELQSDLLITEAEGSSKAYLAEWIHNIEGDTKNQLRIALADYSSQLLSNPSSYRTISDKIVACLSAGTDESEAASDIAQDKAAWSSLVRSIMQTIGSEASLEQFLQEMAMRSKEPPLKDNSVSLMTIHAAKGKEFDHVYLVGLAESVLPSFQSVKAGNESPEMEEERRNCFVAITRTKECLTLSWANRYRGYGKSPSRFLFEMGLLESNV